MGLSRVLLGLISCNAIVGCNTTPVVAPAESAESFEPSPFAPTARRITQTDDTDITSGLSIACADGSGTTENSWYRVYSLRDYNITKPFTVNRVNFGVQSALGKQRVKVAIGTYQGDAGSEQLDLSKVDTLAMTTIAVPPTDTGVMQQANFPAVEIPYGTNLIVEVRTEGHSPTNGSYFYLGATKGKETIPGYLRAPACSAPDPLMTSALGYLASHLVIAVSGTE